MDRPRLTYFSYKEVLYIGAQVKINRIYRREDVYINKEQVQALSQNGGTQEEEVIRQVGELTADVQDITSKLRDVDRSMIWRSLRKRDREMLWRVKGAEGSLKQYWEDR